MDEKSKFQEKISKLLDNAIEEYIHKQDSKSATAFAFKMKERMQFTLQALEQTDISVKTKDEKETLLNSLTEQIEKDITSIKQEVADIVAREKQIPSYIGFINEKEVK